MSGNRRSFFYYPDRTSISVSDNGDLFGPYKAGAMSAFSEYIVQQLENRVTVKLPLKVLRKTFGGPIVEESFEYVLTKIDGESYDIQDGAGNVLVGAVQNRLVGAALLRLGISAASLGGVVLLAGIVGATAYIAVEELGELYDWYVDKVEQVFGNVADDVDLRFYDSSGTRSGVYFIDGLAPVTREFAIQHFISKSHGGIKNGSLAFFEGTSLRPDGDVYAVRSIEAFEQAISRLGITLQEFTVSGPVGGKNDKYISRGGDDQYYVWHSTSDAKIFVPLPGASGEQAVEINNAYLVDASGKAELVYGNSQSFLTSERLLYIGDGSLREVKGDSNDPNVIIAAKTGQRLVGGKYDDYLVGASGADELIGGAGRDRLFGAGGNDLIPGETDNDEVDGGTGRDTWNFSARTSGLNFNVSPGGEISVRSPTDGLDTAHAISIEELVGTSAADIVYALKNPATEPLLLRGGGGSDDFRLTSNLTRNVTIADGGVDDKLFFGSEQIKGTAQKETDTQTYWLGSWRLRDLGGGKLAIGEPGQEIVYLENFVSGNFGIKLSATFSAPGGNLSGTSGNDYIVGTDRDDTLIGRAGNDTLIGGGGYDYFIPGPGNDSLDGGEGPDLLAGEEGIDTLVGGNGDDIYFIRADDTYDLIVELNGEAGGVDTVFVYQSLYVLPQNVENMEVREVPGGFIKGNKANNFIWISVVDANIDGDAGEDTVSYTYMDRGVTVSLDTKLATAGAGVAELLNIENVIGGRGNDQISGNADANKLAGEGGDDVLRGNAGNDELNGGAGNDTLSGGYGSDILTGGDGADVFLFDVNTNIITNYDVITDFVPGVDKLELDRSSFTAFNANGVADGNFVAGAGLDKGLDADDYLVYNTSNGTLYYDPDGSGAAPGLQLIKVNSATPLSARDVRLIVRDGLATMVGTTRGDALTGGNGDDRIEGLAGNDTLNGGAGSDTLLGGQGNDTLDGGTGSDIMAGDEGHDVYYVRDAGDVVIEAVSLLYGGKNGDVAIDEAGLHLYGSKSGDVIHSYIADLTLPANVENGRIQLTGAANLTGNSGNNWLYAGVGDNRITGGAGNDVVMYESSSRGVTVDLAITGAQDTRGSGTDTLIGIGGLSGSQYGDILSGDGGDNVLWGENGDDALYGRGGNDSLIGSWGADTLVGGSGDDTFTAGPDYDVVDGGDGSDTLLLQSSPSILYTLFKLSLAVAGRQELDKTYGAIQLSSIENIVASATAYRYNFIGNGAANRLESSINNDTLEGGAGNDTLDAGQGHDLLYGGDDKDILTGGLGNDTLDGGTGLDVAVFAFNRLNYTVTKQGNTAVAVSGSEGLDALSNVERLRFQDSSLALDVDGNAGKVAKIVGAVFGKTPETQKYIGMGLHYMDRGMSYVDLMQWAIDARLGKGAGNRQIVDLLYTNVVGTAPSDAAAQNFVNMLENRAHTTASLGVLAAETSLNLANIDLVGLMQTGVPYIEYLI